MCIESDDESQAHLYYDNSDCDELCCYSDNNDDSTTCYEESDSSSYSEEREVLNNLEDWLKFTSCNDAKSTAAL